MAKILFRILPESGHLNATFLLARRLRSRGHTIVYATLPEQKGTIEAQGFEFHEIEKDLLRNSPVRFVRKRRFNPLAFVVQLPTLKRFRIEYREEYMEGVAFDSVIKSISPDLLLIDSPYSRHSVTMAKHKIPFMIVESMLPLHRASDSPPLCSSIVPTGSHFSKFRCDVAWKRYHFSTWFKHLLGFQPKPSPQYIGELCRKVGFPVKDLEFDRYFHLGIKNCPELILSPIELDIPRAYKKNQFFIGPSCDLERSETSYDMLFDRVFKDIVAARKRSDKHQGKIIYCSLGGLSFRYIGIEQFFRRLITCFQKYLKHTLILSIGNELNIEEFTDLPENVYLFRRVPQLRLLSKTDLMITHGGMNSITECVMMSVPMLVYPGNNKIDQAGNAARVVYHELGLRGILTKDNPRSMAAKIQHIIENPSFQSNVEEKRKQIHKNANYNRGAEIIESYIRKI